MKLILLLISLIIIPNSLAFLQITEIMYAPIESEYYNEYIEIKNVGTTPISIENLTLCNKELFPGFINHTDEETYLDNFTEIQPNQFIIITDGGSGTEAYNNYNISENSAPLHPEGATICGWLDNEGGIITVSYNEELNDTLHYYSEWGANNNGKSLCIINNIWRDCLPSPGQENTEQEQTYNIKINEFLPNPQGNDDAPMPEGEWIELKNLDNQMIDLEGFYLKDKANHKISITETTTYSTEIETFLTVYTNGFFGFLNNGNGTEIITLHDKNGVPLDEVSYGSSSEGISWSKTGNIWRQTTPTPNEENEQNQTKFNSELKIEKIYTGRDNRVKFGENIRVRLTIYRGNTSKTSISAWIEKSGEKISKRTRFNINKKFEEKDITIPIQIFPNCNKKFSDGEYTLVVEGLNEEDKNTIDIQDITKNLCEKQKCEIKEISKGTHSETNINQPKSTIKEIVYESTNKKAGKQAIYIFCLTLTLLIIQLTTERWKK